jgi:seryl-tRNA synthetase
MFDVKWIRDNPSAFDRGLARRGLAPESDRVLEFDRLRREAQTAAQAIQEERNALSKQIGVAKAKGEDAAPLMARVTALKDALAEAESKMRAAEQDQNAFLAGLPNIPADDVPDGADELANVELRRHGTPPKFGFAAKEHDDLGQALGGMDFERAAKLAGARFVVLKGQLARLERSLAQFMLDLHTREFGYTEVSPPALVRDAAVFGTGQLPKFADDLFRTADGYWLIPTAEVPLTNMVAGEILDAGALPLRFTALTPCFRAEA